MAVKEVKAIINNAAFPLLYSHAVRSALESQDSAPRMPGSFVGSAANFDYSIPQVIFLENVLPLARGYLSVGVAQQAAAIAPAVDTFDQLITIRDENENQRLFAPAKGANYVFDPYTNTWTSEAPFTFSNSLVTRAYVNGRTFIFFEKTKCVEYNETTDNLDTVTFTYPPGLAVTDVRGIGSAGNYLLLFTDVAVYWCSPLNVLDFSDIDAGAGNQTPADIKGQIACILPLSKGAIIYTTRNCVAMRTTNNSGSPFVFAEVDGAGGVASWERVGAESSESYHFAWTTAGLQRIALTNAETIEPEVTDFLVGGKYDTWDSTLKQVVESDIGGPFSVKLTFLVSRYLIISYGTDPKTYSNALVYDTSLKRWGKIKFDHVDCGMYSYPSVSGDWDYDELPGFYADLGELTYDELDTVRLITPAAKRGICFLQRDGSLHILSTDYTQAGSAGVIVFGHLQSLRGRNTTVHSVEVEGERTSPAPKVYVLSSETGYRRSTLHEGVANVQESQFSQYDMYAVGRNHDIVVESCFVLTGLILSVANHGSR